MTKQEKILLDCFAEIDRALATTNKLFQDFPLMPSRSLDRTIDEYSTEVLKIGKGMAELKAIWWKYHVTRKKA